LRRLLSCILSITTVQSIQRFFDDHNISIGGSTVVRLKHACILGWTPRELLWELGPNFFHCLFIDSLCLRRFQGKPSKFLGDSILVGRRLLKKVIFHSRPQLSPGALTFSHLLWLLLRYLFGKALPYLLLLLSQGNVLFQPMLRILLKIRSQVEGHSMRRFVLTTLDHIILAPLTFQ